MGECYGDSGSWIGEVSPDFFIYDTKYSMHCEMEQRALPVPQLACSCPVLPIQPKGIQQMSAPTSGFWQQISREP
jgi:hypothetical protein